MQLVVHTADALRTKRRQKTHFGADLVDLSSPKHCSNIRSLRQRQLIYDLVSPVFHPRVGRGEWHIPQKLHLE